MRDGRLRGAHGGPTTRYPRLSMAEALRLVREERARRDRSVRYRRAMAEAEAEFRVLAEAPVPHTRGRPRKTVAEHRAKRQRENEAKARRVQAQLIAEARAAGVDALLVSALSEPYVTYRSGQLLRVCIDRQIHTVEDMAAVLDRPTRNLGEVLRAFARERLAALEVTA